MRGRGLTGASHQVAKDNPKKAAKLRAAAKKRTAAADKLKAAAAAVKSGDKSKAKALKKEAKKAEKKAKKTEKKAKKVRFSRVFLSFLRSAALSGISLRAPARSQA